MAVVGRIGRIYLRGTIVFGKTDEPCVFYAFTFRRGNRKNDPLGNIGIATEFNIVVRIDQPGHFFQCETVIIANTVGQHLIYRFF